MGQHAKSTDFNDVANAVARLQSGKANNSTSGGKNRSTSMIDKQGTHGVGV